MDDLKNDEIAELYTRILDDTSEKTPVELWRNLIDMLNGCEVLCPVDDEGIIFYGWGSNLFIPACLDIDDFNQTFEGESCERLSFNDLEEFMAREVDGIIINPGGRGFILNRYRCQMVFNTNRPKKKVSKGYDVKVRLNDFRPLTWRDLIIPDSISFMELDDILKTLWGFYGHHLSCFLVPKDNLIITDEDLARETMMGCDYEANSTSVSEVFDRYDKITYWYDFGDDWKFDIEIKKKIDYDRDYVTIKRFKGKYNPVEDCKGVYGLSEIVYYAENPDEADGSYFCDLVEYLEEFDMEYVQLELESKAYVRSNWHRDVYFDK